MTQPDTMATPVASWFLVSEEKEPLGQLNRSKDEAKPVVGMELTDGAKYQRVVVVDFQELDPVCGIRRFRVVVRVLS